MSDLGWREPNVSFLFAIYPDMFTQRYLSIHCHSSSSSYIHFCSLAS